MRRRTLLRSAIAAAGGVGVVGVNGLSRAAEIQPGAERVEKKDSVSRGRSVDFYTAVPAGHGDGKGLPVCIVLHGAAKRPGDFARLGFGRALSRAVEKGAPPFVLAGANGGRRGWRPKPGDDPQRMAYEEVPNWCAERGFDITRLALWGWSTGGAGALLLAETFRSFARLTAAFSPAVALGDQVFEQVGRLRSQPLGLWCGLDDRLLKNVQALQRALPLPPVAGRYTDGGHTFDYWQTIIPEAFRIIGSTLD
ncbi:esterase [Asanoa sp. NPDC049573]|uniref:esterase n=1 Tax=Asanoa sp. NPDC049573 TaxID=3155396 RepID=UPI00344782EE